MTPHRTGGKAKGGMFRFDRVFSGVGRINCSSGTDNVREFRRRDGILTKLFDAGQLDVLKLFKAGEVPIETLIEADRQKRLRSDALLADLATRQNLWKAIEATLPRMGKAQATRDRYALSFAQLRKKAARPLGKGGRPLLAKRARVESLLTCDWRVLAAHWGTGPADWNNMVRAVSHFLSLLFDDVYHPFRRAVMKKLEKQEEPEGRVPDLSVDEFWAILGHVPEVARPAFVTLAATGMRVGEYLSVEPEGLKSSIHAVHYVGKTGQGVKHVDPALWPWIRAAVPCPVGRKPAADVGLQRDSRYKRLYTIWKAAAKKGGKAELTIHDLRHLFGQLAADTMPERMVQEALEHKTAAMTQRYTRRKNKGEVARAVGEQLRGGTAAPAAPDPASAATSPTQDPKQSTTNTRPTARRRQA